jgi:hypothetical protein
MSTPQDLDTKSATATPVAPANTTFTPQKWDTVKEPGSYVCNETGRLLRVPAAAIKDRHHPVVEFLGPKGPVPVTRLSSDPQLGIAELRKLSERAKVEVQF